MINNYRIEQRNSPWDGGRFLAAMSMLVRVSSSCFFNPLNQLLPQKTYERNKK